MPHPSPSTEQKLASEAFTTAYATHAYKGLQPEQILIQFLPKEPIEAIL
jgi:hypothetical protein